MLAPADLASGLDPVLFTRELRFPEPDPWQREALRWSGKRALWNVSRQAGKSTISALIALHTALYKPDSLILLISPSLRQSSELFRKVSDWRTAWPNRWDLPEDNKLSCTLTNGSRIVSLPSSEETIRGFSGVDLIIEDEASRVPDELYYAVRPMLAVSGGRLILMSTPFGTRGHFHQEWTKGGPIWERVEIDATQNPRIAPEFLEEERASMGDWWYQQEYFCKFMDAQTSVFNYQDIENMFRKEIEIWDL